MPRTRHGVVRHRRAKKILKRAKGFFGARHRLFQMAREQVIRSEVYGTNHRKLRKRQMRSLWIIRLSAACRARGLSYSRFIEGLRKADITLDRKVLSEMAIHDPASFDKVVEKVRAHVA